MSDERLQRPALDRTAPIRNWASAMSSGASSTPIEPSLQNANRVVEDYLRAGEASARLFPGVSGAGRPNGAPQDIAQAMMRAASDMMSFWVELLARSTADAAPAAAAGAKPGTHDVGDAEGANTPPRISVAVDSSRPATVTVDLRPEARRATLGLERLHPHGRKAAPLRGISIERAEDESVVIRLRITSDQPAGVYSGVIIDHATSLPVGTVAVTLQAGRGARRATRK